MRLKKPGFISLLAGLAAVASSAETLQAQSRYTDSEIPSEGPFSPLYYEDLNGDGRLDLINTRWQRGLGRELLIYHQGADGRFPAEPQVVEIKTEIIAVGFADLRPDPGKELVLFANNGVFSLSTAQPGYAGNLKPLFAWNLAADIPDAEAVRFFRGIDDIDGDGLVDLLLPGNKTYGFFKGIGPEQFELATEFSTLNLELTPNLRPAGDGDLTASFDINSRDGIKLQVSARQPTPFDGFVEAWQADAETTDNLLRAENWMPPALLADFDGDSRQDVVFLNVGADIRGQLNLLFQQPDGSFPASPDWQGALDTRGDIRLVELNGDGLTDIARVAGEGNEWDISLYLNRDGLFNFDSPDQIMRFSGYEVDMLAIDIDGDDRPELNISYYTIPVVEAIRNTSIVRTQLLYGRDPNGLFSRRPQFRLDESFSASNVRGLTEQMSLRKDVDGDGRPDALYITAEGAVAAKRIDDDLRIADEPFWEYVPARSVIGFSVEDLNQDDLPDLILRHSSAHTVLVATQ